jgi:YD repeat-containing protein
MTGDLVGAERHWTSFYDSPEIAIYDLRNRLPFWRAASTREPVPDPSSYLFNADLVTGLFVLRKVDFHFGGEHPLSFTRAYRNQDERSRTFGIGAADSLDIFLVGEMGVRIDLILEDGAQYRFNHAVRTPLQTGDTYVASEGEFSTAVYAGDTWTVTRKDGWKFYFPYRPNAYGQNVTVLTGFTDSDGKAYRMTRDDAGDLLSVTTPDGQWLHVEHDSEHRVRHIEASTGRSVTYTYDAKGCLSRALDSDGAREEYAYDDRAQMISVSRGSSSPVLVNRYDSIGHLMGQTMADGSKFEYHYRADAGDRGDAYVPDLITYPTGLVTHIHSDGYGYWLSLPSVPPYKTSR